MEKFKKLSKLHKYGAAISFLAMEIFALIIFSFGDNFILYSSLSISLMVLLILFNIRQINVDGVSSIAFLIFPLFLYVLLSALGIYSRAHVIWGDFSTAEIVFIPLGLLPICFSGYLLAIDKTFDIKIFLIVIYGALALLTVINMICNYVNFGMFYTVLYKGYRMYYAGEVSDLTVENFAYVLHGLKFVEVKMSQYVLIPALLLTSSISLLFISPKEHKKTFITYAGFTFVGLFALVTIPTLLGGIAIGIIIVIDSLILLIRKFNKVYKPIKVLIYILLVLIILGVLVFALAHQEKSSIANTIADNGTLNRLFNNNRYAEMYSPSVTNLFFDNFFGNYTIRPLLDPVPETKLTNSFLFDNITTSGVIGALAFIIFLIVGFRGFRRYILNSKDEMSSKVTLLAFSIFFVIFSALFVDRDYALFYRVIRPMYMTGPFFILVFILTYVTAKEYFQRLKKEAITSNSEVSVNA